MSGPEERRDTPPDHPAGRPDAGRGVYSISVAAELTGLGTQTLRLYETRGLLEPARTTGGTRRYSANDLDRLRHISELLSAGLNLAGVAAVLDLEAANDRLRGQLATRHGRAAPRTNNPEPTPGPTAADRP